MEKVIDPNRVMAVKAKGGTSGAEDAFDTLESKLTSLRGRRFYGVYDPLAREYRACVETISGEDATSLGLESWTIPGGKYTNAEGYRLGFEDPAAPPDV